MSQRNTYIILGLSLGIVFYFTMVDSMGSTALLLAAAIGITFVSVGINMDEEESESNAAHGEATGGIVTDSEAEDTGNTEESERKSQE